MPGRKARPSAPWNASLSRPEWEVECVAQLRRIGDKLNSPECGPEILGLLEEMPGKRAQKGAPPSPLPMPAELEAECIQFRRIGDKLNFRQKLLNLISKLFSLIT
ncbi:phorbol-12-myristate-13-acetate-induced protein 1 [Perognathus longimembris pacificus]|uniref:phorbol-12-myristate-13-acetate-induced protein 1 n=1 Tax=Perognathus longimembris pacificus TaxID=214514 RepID=UPI002018FBD9|nr:phorbol-12-myristate-13-acetate-induced protein 1 [Perognathus longimembris pacificus]